MRKYIIVAALLGGLSSIVFAQEVENESGQEATSSDEPTPKTYPSPNAIVDAADASEWIAIKASDLLVMDLEPDRDGKARRVIIQLMPEPFSQGWIRNMRKLAAAKFWDDTAIIRVQDNYVTQWGDPDADGEDAKALPDDLEVVPESGYSIQHRRLFDNDNISLLQTFIFMKQIRNAEAEVTANEGKQPFKKLQWIDGDEYAPSVYIYKGWPVGIDMDVLWPVHCYGMVGVGRDLSPNTGDGSSLYTVIGHAPRHLDRNIALVGRIISGMEHTSSLPRGTGDLGFYETPQERTKIISVRMGNEVSDAPAFEYLSIEGPTFAKYLDARANRRDPFFNVPAGGADICNIPVPIRKKKEVK